MIAYNTNTYFIIFLPAVILLYQLFPKKYRYISLLAASAVFFTLISKTLILFALLAVVISFFGGLAIDRTDGPKKKAVMYGSLVTLVGMLIAFKYTGVFTKSVNIIAPIGISFYTLQAVGYILDIYWKRITHEKNILKYALFMLFFPTIMEGPICRWSDISEKMFNGEPVNGESFSQGAMRIGWGLFKRMLIADRLGVAVNNLYKPDFVYDGPVILFTMIATTVHLYMEFSGTIDIVIGSARIFNIELPENFRQPFFAENAAEFWRRWHITLGVWLKNYVFYPVSTSTLVKKWNKFGKKKLNKYITGVVTSAMALLPVWLINGIWHGPKIPYFMYGVYYFTVLLLEVIAEPLSKSLQKKATAKGRMPLLKGARIFRTWIVIIVGETLFRAETLSQFGLMMISLFRSPMKDGMVCRIMELGLDAGDYTVIVLGMIIVFLVDIMLEKDPDLFKRIALLPTYKRWALYYAVIFSIVVFGAYGTGYQAAELIYAGF